MRRFFLGNLDGSLARIPKPSVFGSGDETSPKFMFITPMLMNWLDIGVRYVSLVQKVAWDRHRMFRIHIGHSRCCVGPYTVPKGF